MHDVLFDLCHYGHMDYFAVYEMPVQYRNFYMRKLIHIKEEEQEAMDKAQGKMSGAAPEQNQIARGPQIQRR